MRSLLIVAAGAGLSLLTSAGLWVGLGVGADREVWCEVVEGRLVRTNASEGTVNSVIDNVLQADRLAAKAPDDALDACRFEQHLDVWFDADLFGGQDERVRRLVRQQLDSQGNPLRITQLHGDEMPTLIFVDHDLSEGDSRAPAVAERIARAIEARSRPQR